MKQLRRIAVFGAEDDSVGVEGIVDRGAFTQELGIAGHSESDRGAFGG